ncbi:MAG: hypothetical protein ACFE9X_13535 [Promethearchaeota archaeon]
MTRKKSYYDWQLSLKSKSAQKKELKNKKKINNNLGISVDEFKRFVKLWKSKNIVF